LRDVKNIMTDDNSLQPNILAAKQQVVFGANEIRFTNEGITIKYTSLSGKKYVTEIKRNSGRIEHTYLSDI